MEKQLKIEAQKMRLEEETKMKATVLRSVIHRTQKKLASESAGSNGQASSNLVPA